MSFIRAEIYGCCQRKIKIKNSLPTLRKNVNLKLQFYEPEK